MEIPLNMRPDDFYSWAYESNDYLTKASLIDGGVYVICARNAYVGLWQAGEGCFTIARLKGKWYLSSEHYFDDEFWADGVVYNNGTAKPLKHIANLVDKREAGLVEFLQQCERDNPIVEGWDSIAEKQQSHYAWQKRLAGVGCEHMLKPSRKTRR